MPKCYLSVEDICLWVVISIKGYIRYLKELRNN